MNNKVIWLHQNIDKYDGYLVPLIRAWHARVERRGDLAEWTHNESVMIQRAYNRYQER